MRLWHLFFQDEIHYKIWKDPKKSLKLISNSKWKGRMWEKPKEFKLITLNYPQSFHLKISKDEKNEPFEKYCEVLLKYKK